MDRIIRAQRLIPRRPRMITCWKERRLKVHLIAKRQILVGESVSSRVEDRHPAHLEDGEVFASRHSRCHVANTPSRGSAAPWPGQAPTGGQTNQ
jgi:hypothetical protein